MSFSAEDQGRPRYVYSFHDSRGPMHNSLLTSHATPHSLPCRMCKQSKHRECRSINSRGESCLCGVCAAVSA